MPENLNQAALTAVKPELTPGETVIWAGVPNTRIVFHKGDCYLIPFSLMWGGFAIFWEAAVLNNAWNPRAVRPAPLFFLLWGVPFVVFGQYFIWGRFIHAAWRKRRTYYAVTTHRVVAVQNNWTRRVASAYIDTLPVLVKEVRSDGYGTLRFSESETRFRRDLSTWDSASIRASPEFLDIADVNSVFDLVSELRVSQRRPKGDERE